jgi:hypothetical protein
MPDPWDGVTFKLGMANFYLDEMRRDLTPATTDPEFSINQLRNTSPPMNRWSPKFYYHLDAFLAATRSVDYIITTAFGVDSMLEKKGWIANLPKVEQDNRKNFKSKYAGKGDPFRKYFLTHIRNVSIHCSGTPSVEVAVLGQWGVYYRGGPTQSIPAFEEPQQLTAADPNHPPRIWTDPVKRAIEPGPDDFFFQEIMPDGRSLNHPLFPSCADYLRSASELVDEAKILEKKEHTQRVTLPPLYDI